MNRPTFTAIVPIYNAERFVERGMICLLKQICQDFEIIAIDDGSSDNSGHILDEMAKNYPRLQVYHKQNEGVGKARNEGMRHASGNYLYFMDIDDRLEPDFFASASNLISQFNNPDLLVFGFTVVDHATSETVRMPDKYIGTKKELSECYTSDIFNVRYGSGFLWNKLYKRSIIQDNDIRFGSFRLMEDELFNIDYMKHVQTTCLCNKEFYTYFLDNAGNSRSKYLPNMLEILECIYMSFLELKNALCITDDIFLDHLNKRTFMGLMNWVRQHEFHHENRLNYTDKVKQLKILKKTEMWKTIYSYEMKKPQSVENRLYAKAIDHESLVKLYIVVKYYAFIRFVINKVRYARG